MNRILSTITLTFGLAANPGIAQTTPAPADSAPSDAEVIVLSPFEVQAGADAGYQAANTISGSRLNTALRDTAATITPLTKEFLEDIAATNLEQMLDYATNHETDYNDNEGFNGIATRQADTTNFPFRIRGQMAGVSIDLAETGVPVDLSQVERVEIASGPNSILFGTGAVGGLVSLSTKRAQLNQSAKEVKFTVGSWGLLREEVDLNHMLVRDKLAFRLFGVNEDADGWRQWDFKKDRRLTGAFAVRPWRSTTLSASYGVGTLRRHITTNFNGGDQITLWLANGGKTDASVGLTASLFPQTTSQRNQLTNPLAANLRTYGLDTYGGTRRFTYVENDGVTYNVADALISRGNVASGTLEGISNTGNNYRLLLDPGLMPHDYSVAGPGARRISRFDNFIARLEQRIGRDLTLEAAFQRNHTDNDANGFIVATGSAMIELRGDPNTLLLPLENTGTRTGVPNPRAGQLYMETNWQPELFELTNQAARLTGAYEMRLGRFFGDHRLAFLAEQTEFTRFRHNKRQILVDQNNAPINNTAQPEHQSNQFIRRNYVVPGDFRTYYMSDPNLPLQPILWGTREFRPYDTTRNATSLAEDSRETESLMLAMQNYWLKRAFVTTLGIRKDWSTFAERETVRAGSDHPLVLEGRALANEFVFSDNPPTVQERDYGTRTWGGVLHLTRRFSLFYNNSNNVGTPRFDRTTIGGVLPPPAEGQGQDAGVMIDVLGDNRFFIRLTAYETSQVGDASIAPGGAQNPSNYYTRSINGMLDHLLANGRVNLDEYDREFQAFSAMTIDTASRGYELEFVANPTRNWTLRMVASYTDQERENFFLEREPHLSSSIAFVRSRDDGGLMEEGYLAGKTIEQGIASLLDEIENAEFGATGVLTGSRELKGNLSSRYSFSTGRLKGVFLGGTFLYQGAPLMQTAPSEASLQWAPQPYHPIIDAAPEAAIYGKAVTQFNLFAGWTTRLPLDRTRLRLQLNINNVTNSNNVTPGRYDFYLTGLRRVYYRNPREYRVTATFLF